MMSVDQRKHSCDVCDKSYTFKQNLIRHVKASHTNSSIIGAEKNRLKCPICNFSPQSVLNLNEHLKNSHDIKLEFEDHKFSSEDDFLAWKSSIEANTLTNFIKVRGTKISKSGSCITYYKCHRSGKFVSKSNGIRRLKIQGSNKINGICPANMKYSFTKKGNIHVNYQKVHVGHQLDIGHLTLTGIEREKLAKKIASNVSLDAILDEVRSSFSDAKLGRIHLLTKQDLHNIEKRYNLSTNVKHQNESASIEKWVEEMKSSESCCVLLYKPQDLFFEEYAQLNINDFILIIMNEAQIEILKKYGNNCICIDRTNDLNAYNYEMITLIVLDETGQGFPCAFLISNRSDEAVISIFLHLIRHKVDILETEIFLSDVDDAFFKSWKEVMGIPKQKLYCHWLIDAVWRKHLVKIKNKCKQQEVYIQLRTLMEETDIQKFKVSLEKTLEELFEDGETTDFALFFTSHYINNTTSWAYCYRLHSILDTNIHLERLHRTIRYIYLQGRNVKRLNKSIHAIMQFVRDKLIDRTIVAQNRKITSDVKNLRCRHRKSMSIPRDLISLDQNDWKVASASGKELYTIQEARIDCKCALICQDCQICVHRYTCSCVDSAIKWNMCKHIHLVCQVQEELNKKQLNVYDVNNEMIFDYIQLGNEETETVLQLEEVECNVQDKLLYIDDTASHVEKGKEDLTIQFQHLLELLTTPEHIAVVKACIDSLLPIITDSQDCSNILESFIINKC